MQNKVNPIGKAWIVRWFPYGDHAIPRAKKYSPQGEILDILSGRKSFDYVYEYARNTYLVSTLSFAEKYSFAHYNKGSKLKEDFLLKIPKTTHYKSSWYIELQKMEADNPGDKKLREKWKKAQSEHSRYVVIGHNPVLEIVEVFNLKEEKTHEGDTVFIWNECIGNNTEKVIHKAS